MNIRFDGKIVAVSGGAIGFGREIALRFLALGAKVHVCDVMTEEMADLAEKGVVASTVDLTDRAAGAAWIRGIEAAHDGHPIDILVNNAGGVAGQTPVPIEDVEDADWDKLFAINVDAAFVLSRAVAAGMKRAGTGKIVNISSGAALQVSLTGIQAYCSSKHAVLGLTRQLAHELGPFGIHVNSVAPGLVHSNEATRKQWEAFGEARQRSVMAGISLGRLGTPADIANAVIFFASDLASFVNGQVLSVDGGK